VSGAWHSHARTDAGRVREHNEDAVLELADERLWCVADGMGGHHDGAHASALTVATLADYRASAHRGIATARLGELVARCHTALQRRARERGVDTVGCTLAVLTLHRGSALASWCGDARVYRVRRGRLLEMTRDHAVGVESDDRDRHLSIPPIEHGRAALTAAIGDGGASPRLEHAWFTLDPGDRFAICTDGLTKEASDREILDDTATADCVEDQVARLFGRYLERGARDNIGVIGVAADA